MPLDDITSSLNRQPTSHHHHVFKGPVNLLLPGSSYAKPPPSAVQGMLKSSTETGDVGMFTNRPPRVPKSATQTSLAPSSMTYRSHQPRYRAQKSYAGRPPTSKSSLQRRESSRSDRSTGVRPISRRYRPSPYPYQHHQYTAFDMSAQHRLHSHRSLVSLRSNPAYSTKSRYPIRAPSPATSNVYDYQYLHTSRQNSFRSEFSSPVSNMSAVNPLRVTRIENPGARASLRALPSPNFANVQPYVSEKQFLTPSTTPVPIAASNLAHTGVTSPTATPTSPVDSIVPFYYDYSESFHGRQALLQPRSVHSTRSDASTQDQIVPAAQSPFGIITRSKLRPAELPARHNRRSSDLSARHSRKASSRSSRSANGPISQPIQEEAGDEQMPCVASAESKQDIETQELPSLNPQQRSDSQQPMNGIRNWPSPSSSTFFVNASRSPRNLTDLAARAHSPEPELNTVMSIDAVTMKEPFAQLESQSSNVPITTDDGFSLPAFKFRPLSIRISPCSRPSASPVSLHAVPEIISPYPKRPESSQSRKKFSRILDADHNESLLDYYTTEYPTPSYSSGHLERVEEATSPNFNTQRDSPGSENLDHRPPKSMHSFEPPSTQDRESGVTSHDISTVESLLEKHIECLGLGSGGSPSSRLATNNELNTIPESTSGLPFTLSSVQVAHTQSSQPCRPTSLTSSAAMHLIPRKLFAHSIDPSILKFPLASSDSDRRFSLAWSEDKSVPPYGWLALPSEGDTALASHHSLQTLLSGDFADVESGHMLQKFRVSRRSTPNVNLRPRSDETDSSTRNIRSKCAKTPCRRSKSDATVRTDSQKHRKMTIHLKAKAAVAETASGSEWLSTIDSSQSDRHLQRLGLTRIPISAVDGFAELSGESANASQQSLASLPQPSIQRSPDTWSTIVDAMPRPSKKTHSVRRQDSAKTINSVVSKRSVAEPVNSSRRQSVKIENSAPCLASLDLGPAIRVSKFGLSGEYRVTSPRYKQSPSSEPKDVSYADPLDSRRHNTRNRDLFYSFRNIVPSSMRSFTISADAPQRSHSHAQACHVQHSTSFCDPPIFSDTVAMSDFAYRKHKLFEKVKGWCRKRCNQKRLLVRKERPIPPGGFIV